MPKGHAGNTETRTKPREGTEYGIMKTPCTEAGLATVGTYDRGIEGINAFRIVVCAVGLLGNITVILTILFISDLRKRTTSWYVMQLAIADTAFLLTLPFQIVEDQRNSWIFPDWMCKAKQTVLFVNYYSSISFLMIMAIDRYIAICHGFSERLRKFRTKRATCITIASVWIVCVLICIPVMIFSQVQGFKPTCKCRIKFPTPPKEPPTVDEMCIKEGMGDNTIIIDDGMTMLDMCRLMIDEIKKEDGYCLKPLKAVAAPDIDTPKDMLQLGCHYSNYAPSFTTFLYFNFTVMFLVPFCVIVVCYSLIVRYIMKSSSRMKIFSNENPANDDRKHTKVVIMCATLVAVFTFCWVPYHGVHLAKMSGIRGSSTLCNNLLHATSLLVYLNSAINPFVYFIVARFRREIRKRGSISTFISFFTRSSAVASTAERLESALSKERSRNEYESNKVLEATSTL